MRATVTCVRCGKQRSMLPGQYGERPTCEQCQVVLRDKLRSPAIMRKAYSLLDRLYKIVYTGQ